MTSVATVIIKPSSRGMPLVIPPRPITVFLKARSFMSRHLFTSIFLVSIFSSFPWWIWLSSTAHIRLFAAVMACISPVKCKFISSIGSAWEYPPPVAPPFMPKTGPSEGSLRAITAFLLSLLSAWPNPIVTVVLPSPAGVGFIAVTRISFPSGQFSNLLNIFSLNFAL